MSIIIRLQNLPWSANSVDIRRFFAGLSIPEGGVHIVGGEMGDAFIAFSTDEDARQAMEKNGGKIKDMQIKLLLSSRTEMMRVIEQARQQNMVVAQPHMVAAQPTILTLPMQQMQQPTRIMTPTSEPDRRRGRSPSPRRRSRDRSPVRDRRRSPDERRGSKRDRSRSPSRSSRSFSRDTDRRSDRFKRDDRRYDDSRYRDDRRSARDSPQEPKKYMDADHVHSRSQLHDTAGFRDMQPAYDQTSNIGMSGMYPFVSQQSHSTKNFTDTYSHPSINSSSQLSQSESVSNQKPAEMVGMGDQKHSAMSNMYSEEQMSFRSSPFEPPTSSAKETSGHPPVEQQMQKSRRRTRFEPEFASSSAETHFPNLESNTKPPMAENQLQSSAYNAGRPPQDDYSEARNIWSREMPEKPENSSWNDKRQPLLNPSISKNGDFLQVVPMDLDPSPSELTPEKEIYQESNRLPPSYGRTNASPRNDEPRRETQNRGPILHNDNQGKIPPSLTVEVRGLPPDARIDDVLDLFRGIPLPAANIRIQANDHGFEKAFIRFVSVAHFEEALSRNRRFVHEGRCELVPCPASAFDDAVRPQKPRPKPKPREEDLTVQLRGLPFSCKDDDVVRFFDGLTILDLYVVIGSDGRATGSGFVEFGSPKDFRSALAMNGKMIGRRYITVSVAGKEMMAFARGEEYNPVTPDKDSRLNAPHPSNNYPPASNQDRSLQPPNQNRPLLPSRPPPPGNQGRMQPPPENEGRMQPPPGNQGRMQTPPGNQGRMQPQPGNQGRMQPQPGNQGRMQSQPGNQGRMQPQAGNQGRIPPQPGNQGRMLPQPGNQGRMPPQPGNQGRMPQQPGNQGRMPPQPGNQGRMQPPPGNQGRMHPPPCISMKGLPENVTNRDIADFLGQVGVMPRAIHIMLRPDKMPSGDAYAELGTPPDVDSALEMDGKFMSGNQVSMQPISFHEMSEILGRPCPAPPPPAPGALLRTPNEMERPRRPLLPQALGDMPYRERPRMEPPPRGGRPLLEHFNNRMEGPRGRPHFSPRMRGPRPARPFKQEGRFPPPAPPSNDRGVKDFGAPGCVVSINNLHFRAGLEELLDFFGGYNITKDSIIRKYNENGQTTGEARVAFQNPRDAQRAVRELNQKPIMGRSLSLSIL